MLCPICETQNSNDAYKCINCDWKFVVSLSKPTDEDIKIYNLKVQKAKDHQSFKTTQKLDNELSYNEYLKNYPYGLHEAEALRKIVGFMKIKQEKAKEEKRQEELEKEGIIVINGLMWEKETRKMNWHKAMEYAKNLRLGGHNDWRLPTIEELKQVLRSCGGTIAEGDSNYERIRSKNEIHTQYQNNCKNKGFKKDNFYWSLTSVSGSTYLAWGVYFYDGGLYYLTNGNTHAFRCVRNS